jgi:hypothetical protein
LFWIYCFMYAPPAHKNTLQKFLYNHNKYMRMTSRLIAYWSWPLNDIHKDDNYSTCRIGIIS